MSKDKGVLEKDKGDNLKVCHHCPKMKLIQQCNNCDHNNYDNYTDWFSIKFIVF